MRRLTLVVGLTFLTITGSAAAAFPGTNGRIAFVSDRDGNDEIYSVAPDGSDPQRLTANTVVDAEPAVSPDGARIAFRRNLDIWVMNADGSGAHAITGTEAPDYEPAWSPDGTRIVYRAVDELWVVDADGTDRRQLTVTPGAASRYPAWSPDGTRIAFQSNVNAGGFDIYTIPADASSTSTFERITENFVEDQHPAWSPDGARIAFQRGSGTGTEVWVADADGTDGVALTDNAHYDGNPAFSPDGTTIVFESDADGDRELVTLPAGGGATPVNLTSTTSGIADEQPDWGPPPPPPPPPPVEEPPPDDPPVDQPPGDQPPPVTAPAPEQPKASCLGSAGFGLLVAIGCFETQGDVSVTTGGNVRINGIPLVPVGDARLTVDRDAKRIHSGNGSFTVYLGIFPVYTGKIDWTIGAGPVALATSKGATVGRLPVLGGLSMELLSGARARIRGLVEMPFFKRLQQLCQAFCPEVSADIVAVTDNEKGLPADGLQLSARNVLLGLAVVEQFDGLFVPSTGTWQASGNLKLHLPQPLRVRVNWVVDEQRVQTATGTLEGVRTAINFGVFLRRLELGMRADPFEFHGALQLEAGPQLLGRPALSFDGGFLLRPARIASGQQGMLRVEGQTKLADVPLTGGHFQLWPSGAADFAVNVQAGFPNLTNPNPRSEPVFVAARLAGWLAKSSFSAEGAAELLVLGQQAAAAELVVSSLGVAGCGQLGWFRGGFGRRWTEQFAQVLGGSCDVGSYRPKTAAARAAQAGPLTLELTDGPRGAVLRFRGEGGPPVVVLEGPGGRRIEAPADGSPLVSPDAVVLRDAAGAATHVAIRRAAGTWRATTAEGSPAIAGVDSADVLAPPSVKASVSGRGDRRVLSWRTAARPGQRVTFAELGTDATKVIKRTTAARGRVRFAPAPGNATRRKIVAVVEQGGIPRDSIDVASYRAPKWKAPAKPRKLRVRRRGSALVVSWKRPRGAAGHAVTVRSGGGERELFLLGAMASRVRVPGIGRRERATVEVRGLRSDNVAGRAARKRVR